MGTDGAAMDATGPDGAPMLDAASDGATDAGVETTTLRGRVFSMNGSALAGARVRSPVAETTSDDEGRYEVQVPVGRQATVRAHAVGHAVAIEPVHAVPDAEAYLELSLVPLTTTATIDTGVGGVIAGGGTTVEVPADAFVTADGSAVSGMVDMSLAVLDPRSPDGLGAFPGSFEASRAGGEEGLLESLVVVDISAAHGGEDLDLAPGMGMDVEWPALDASAAETSIPIWSLDPDTGRWAEEGEAIRIGNSFRGRIEHMSWWNLDRFRDNITCFRGCVEHEGEPVRNARVRVQALGFSMAGGGFTNGDGCFAENFATGARIRVQATAIQGVSPWETFTTSATRMRVEDDRSACQDLGVFELVERDLSEDPCPDGKVTCETSDGETCVDLVNDPNHCGGCGARCDGGGDEGGGDSGIWGASCIAGVCECAPGEMNCSDRCVDVRTDHSNCGSCGNICPDGQGCLDGSCQDIECAGDLEPCGRQCVDKMSDDANCGECGTRCGGEADGGGEVCIEGTCQCPEDHDKCGGSWCIDLSSRLDHCGECDNACTDTQTCESGTCTEIECEEGLTICSRSCVDTETDSSNCGDCDIGCELEAGEECIGGSCGCPEGRDKCGGYFCRDLSTDRDHCGACDDACADDEICDGTCTACPAGETVCRNECIDTSTEMDHCGGCFERCNLEACDGGGCTCGEELACPEGGDGGITFSCVADGSTDCEAGDVSGPCDDFHGTWTGGCSIGSYAEVTQRDCAAQVMAGGGDCYAVGILSGDTMSFECLHYDASCTFTLTGTDTAEVSCTEGTDSCTGTATRDGSS